MEEKQIEDLFRAIKADDVKSFSFIMSSNENLNLCYGRFPILSLLYLYSSFKILSKFEKILMPIHNYKIYPEYYEIYRDFKLKAKKALRLFGCDEIVYPVLMLAVLDERIILNKCYENLYRNDSTDEKLQQIYRIRHRTGVSNTENGVVLPKPMMKKKQVFSFIVCSFFLAVILAASLIMVIFVKNNIGFGTAASPIKISSEEEFVQALKHGDRHYILCNDIELTNDYSAENFSGTIYGDGHKLNVGEFLKNGLFEKLSGKISNLKINFSIDGYNALDDYFVLAREISGTVEDCEISGLLNINYSGTNDEEGAYFSVFCINNSGTIINSKVSVLGNIVNLASSNAYFGLFVGKNEKNGKIINCTTDQKEIFVDTVDIAGIACENYGEIRGCTNRTTLSQTSQKLWHPNVAGISIVNGNVIESSYNYGKISAISTTETAEGDLFVFVGGIACENRLNIINCKNFGEVDAQSQISHIVAGGLISQNVVDGDKGYSGIVENCLCNCDVEAISASGQVCVGGLIGINYGKLNNSGFFGNIDANTNCQTDSHIFTYQLDYKIVLYAGGLVGFNKIATIDSCYADFEFTTYDAGENFIKLYCGCVGCLDVVQVVGVSYGGSLGMDNITNNYYVDKDIVDNDSTEKCAYGIRYYYTMFATCQLLTVEENDKMIKCASLENIPLEVAYE